MSDSSAATVLVVDDNTENIKLAAHYLREEGYRIAFSTDGEKTLSMAGQTVYDLILMDVMMPDIDGYETCRRLKKIPEYRDVPVIFLTARTDKESIVQGFHAGGADYLTKPFHGEELVLRVQTHLELKRSREKLEELNAELQKELLSGIKLTDELNRSREELQRANKQLHEMATTDPLTGMMNRRRMLDFLEYEETRMKRHQTPYTLIMCDIDHFKSINDTYGHDAGDAVLRNVARLFQDSIRKQDKASRWGGEEFLLLLPETGSDGAFTLAEKLRSRVESMKTVFDDQELVQSMTFGIAVAQSDTDYDQLITRADAALYEGKNAGRNRSVLYRSSGACEESNS